MANKKVKHLLPTLDAYFNPSAGQIPLILLDAGTIIDLEVEHKEDRSSNKSNLFLNRLRGLASIVIPESILNEVTNHHLTVSLNGKPEISKDVYGLVGLS